MLCLKLSFTQRVHCICMYGKGSSSYMLQFSVTCNFVDLLPSMSTHVIMVINIAMCVRLQPPQLGG